MLNPFVWQMKYTLITFIVPRCIQLWTFLYEAIFQQKVKDSFSRLPAGIITYWEVQGFFICSTLFIVSTDSPYLGKEKVVNYLCPTESHQDASDYWDQIICILRTWVPVFMGKSFLTSLSLGLKKWFAPKWNQTKHLLGCFGIVEEFNTSSSRRNFKKRHLLRKQWRQV